MAASARRAAPVPLGDLLNQAFHRHGWSRSTAHHTVFESWAQIMPEDWRPRCRAVSFRAGKLIVAVDSSPLFEDLRVYRSASLLRLVNEAIRASGRLPIVEVRALEFRRS